MQEKWTLKPFQKIHRHGTGNHPLAGTVYVPALVGPHGSEGWDRWVGDRRGRPARCGWPDPMCHHRDGKL
jgi:hypothetical protein